MNKFTDEDVQKYKDQIDVLTQYECCKLYRFAPAEHIYFRNEIPGLYTYFLKRLKEVGGMTSKISDELGW